MLSTQINNLKTNWKSLLQEVNAPMIPELDAFLAEEKRVFSKHLACYPPEELILNAFNHFDVEGTRVVILGQDPYIRDCQAMGLSFSVSDGTKLPPSLKNIYSELESDLGGMRRMIGNLTDWVDQGVMLLNTALTVREGDSNSHAAKWQPFTDNVIKVISDHCDHVVFLLWGKPAQKKEKLIDSKKHFIIKSAHPSPLSAYRGFFGSKPFSQTNEALVEFGYEPIIWK